ncbi:MAG: DNA helicase RecQ [Bacteroidota bacterium]
MATVYSAACSPALTPQSLKPMPLSPAKQTLKKYFGFDEFRPLQEEIVESLVSGKDCLVLMPTGGGKSLCYQLPALLLDGLTIVVSPLIALMRNQVQALLANGIGAAVLNSSLSADEQRRTEEDAMAGRLKLLYVSPERLVTEGFLAFLPRLNVKLFAIDEAHCVSHWGHDFRPEYRKLAILKERFPKVPMIALTATADRPTRRDIAANLHLQEPAEFVSSFARPNIYLQVLQGIDRHKQIVKFLANMIGQSGIVYCLSRRECENMAVKLRAAGHNAEHYHAGMSTDERSRVQDAFINDSLSIVCATIAFGMGIDKPNVRFVIHYSMPRNPEGYYQEIGRAGRDGLPCKALLFYSYQDVIKHREMIEEDDPAEDRLRVLISKLSRMQQFAETLHCRRRVMLNYFSEPSDTDCGNCDNCATHRTTLDGTIIAQKALSAISRVKESEAMGMIIDILRGSRSSALLAKGYLALPTHGKGADLRYEQWRDYLVQFINLGLIEQAIDMHNVLRLTPLSEDVLKGRTKVDLSVPDPVEIAEPETKGRKPDFRAGDAPTRAKAKAASEKVTFERKGEGLHHVLSAQLADELRKFRKEVASENGWPPYVVFGDKTLAEFTELLPRNRAQMMLVNGIGEKKFDLIGKEVIQIIDSFCKEHEVG